MEGGSHYGTCAEGSALAGGGEGEQSTLPIRIRCNPRVADHKPRETAPPYSEASGRAPGECLRIDESACGDGDEEELSSNQGTAAEPVNRHPDVVRSRSAMPKAEDGTAADRVVGAGPSSSSKRKQESKAPEIPTCPECGKTFRSDKSLFGHLRCHPERDYRGVNPPPNARKILQSTAPLPVAKCLPAKEAPIVAAATTAAVAAADDDDEDPEATAAFILINLSDAKHWGGKTAAFADQEETGSDNKQVVHFYCDRIDSIGWSNSNGDEPPTSSSCKKTKKRKLNELEMVNDSNSSSYGGGSRRSYQCSICLKAFSSHQALGGHIASHNKQKSNLKEAAATSAAEEAAKLNNNGQGLPLRNATVAVIKFAMPEHRCTSCNQTFSSGQALGGHKRRHFNELHQAPSCSSAENRSAPSSSPLESSESEKRGANINELQHSSESEKGQIRIPFKFDLNEVPENIN